MILKHQPIVFRHKGLEYKFGKHGFLYYLLNGFWKRSSKDPEAMKVFLNRKH